MSDQPVLVEKRRDITLISLNRPERRNAVDGKLSRALREAFDHFDADPSASVAVIKGQGAAFCSGMDLKAFLDGEADDILFGEGRLGGLVSRNLTKPLVAAVHGVAVAGGFELMLACDLVVSADTCRFGLPEAKRGLVAGAGGAFRLGEILPPVIAAEILLTGELFGAQRAYELGLVNRIVPESEVLETALMIARAIALNAPMSRKASLDLARASLATGRSLRWAMNDDLLKTLIASEDAVEGAAAFNEKRLPVWRGV